jgi:hypothetical protein
MKSKNTSSADNLCIALRQSLFNKKINKNMHAKLSWKLHDLGEIKDRKIKNFKFLELNWQLEAIRTPDKTLEVKLILLDTSNQPGYTYNIGVFYTKLFWSL